MHRPATGPGDFDLMADVALIQSISIIPNILDVICRTTGMGFAAVARVTEDRWITCSAADHIGFGLVPGSELQVETTICHEIRQNEKAVIIDDVAADADYRDHHTPLQYGFRSYISIPIHRKDGGFFGTLCAIDPAPALLNTPEVIGMFHMFSDLISFHLQAAEQVALSEAQLILERESRIRELELKNKELERVNRELESFTHVVSHDLQEPLRKIQTFAGLILTNEHRGISEAGQHHFARLRKSVKRMQTLVKDLVTYTTLTIKDQNFSLRALDQIIDEVASEFREELEEQAGIIAIDASCRIEMIPFQISQLMQNLISNAIKYARPDVPPIIRISSETVRGEGQAGGILPKEVDYCHLRISDNGIGFDEAYSEKIFEVFQRLHTRDAYDGTGIGLSIVKRIVENHNGVIMASGAVNEGARFDIYLPVIQSKQPEPAEARSMEVA